MSTWDANQYCLFEQERTQPVYDLLHRVQVSDVQQIIDLGCGPGNSTAVAKQQWPDATVCGLDNSALMLAKAREDHSNIHWQEGDIQCWKETGFDLIVANASLQWLPDHETLLPRLLSSLNKGGALAVQMPARYASEIHTIINNVAQDSRWKALTQQARDGFIVKPPAFYYNTLATISSHIDLWEATYFHKMDSIQSIIDWVKGAGMRSFLEILSTEEEKIAFEQSVYHHCESAYPQMSDGCYLMPFRRLFFVAYS